MGLFFVFVFQKRINLFLSIYLNEETTARVLSTVINTMYDINDTKKVLTNAVRSDLTGGRAAISANTM